MFNRNFYKNKMIENNESTIFESKELFFYKFNNKYVLKSFENQQIIIIKMKKQKNLYNMLHRK